MPSELTGTQDNFKAAQGLNGIPIDSRELPLLLAGEKGSATIKAFTSHARPNFELRSFAPSQPPPQHKNPVKILLLQPRAICTKNLRIGYSSTQKHVVMLKRRIMHGNEANTKQ